MVPDPKLHHAATRIAPGSLETLFEMFGLLGVKEQYRQPGARWAMVGQDWLDFSIQLIETEVQHLDGEARINSQISFLSEDPASQIAKIEKWAAEKDIKFVKGSWNEREHWFDLPELFCDSVIEIMHTSVVED